MLVSVPTAYGVNYSVSLIAPNGKVAATAQATPPAAMFCGTAPAAALPLPVSTSNSSVYFMDDKGDVRRLSPDGSLTVNPVINLPRGADLRSMFAVSPDDSEMAVVTIFFNVQGGATTNLYLDQLKPGGSQLQTFTESGPDTLWPLGWHAGELVLATEPACTQNAGPGPLELHVVNPTTAARLLVIGGTDCVIASAPTPAGALCETSTIDFKVYNWSGQLLKQEPSGLSSQAPVYLSPNAQNIAVTDGTTTHLAYNAASPLAMNACGWIDDTHILAGGDAQQQPRVGDFASGSIVPVAAQGVCGGRIPGGL